MNINFTGPKKPIATFVFAHGAGAGMDSPFMEFIAGYLADHKIRVARFEFPYMARAREENRRLPPNRAPVLLETYADVIRQINASPMFIGGKSMGGRIASMIAADESTDGSLSGVICLGYPFHPPGKPDKLRIEHLQDIETPVLILQGERDAFGKQAEVGDYPLSDSIRIEWLPDGDHSFKPRKSSGRTEQQNWQDAATRMVRFMTDSPPA